MTVTQTQFYSLERVNEEERASTAVEVDTKDVNDSVESISSREMEYEPDDESDTNAPRKGWSNRLEDILRVECVEISESSDSYEAPIAAVQLKVEPLNEVREYHEPLQDVRFETGAFVFPEISYANNDYVAAALFLLQSTSIRSALQQQNTVLSRLLTELHYTFAEGRVLEKICGSSHGFESIVNLLLSRLAYDEFKPNDKQIDALSANDCLKSSQEAENAFVVQATRGVAEYTTRCKCGKVLSYKATQLIGVVFTAARAPCSIEAELAKMASHEAICAGCVDLERVLIKYVYPPEQLLVFVSFGNALTRSPIIADIALAKSRCGRLFSETDRNFEYRLESVVRKSGGAYTSFQVLAECERYLDSEGAVRQRPFVVQDPWVVALSYQRVDLDSNM